MHIHDIIKKNGNKLYYVFIINSYFTRINILYFIKLISHAIFNLPQTQFDYVNFQLINTHLRWFNDKNIQESNKMIRLLDYFSFVRSLCLFIVLNFQSGLVNRLIFLKSQATTDLNTRWSYVKTPVLLAPYIYSISFLLTPCLCIDRTRLFFFFFLFFFLFSL